MLSNRTSCRNSHTMRIQRGYRRLAVGAVLLLTGVIVAGCTQQLLGGSEQETAQESTQPLAGEPSTPDPSPQALANLPGTHGQWGEPFAGAADVGMGEQANSVAVLHPGKLSIGTPQQLVSGQATTVDLDSSCHHLATSATGVAVACQGQLLEFNAEGSPTRRVGIDGTVSSGTFTESGRAVAGKQGSDRVFFYDTEGKETASEVTTKNTDDMLLVNTGAGRPQRVAVIDRSQTRINDVSVQDESLNAALRIGQGVGDAATGRGDDGVIVASDHRQRQVQIFTMLDVVRLHQEAPVGPSPWAVRWDFARQIAWVSTTGDNKLTGYRISSGTPEPLAQLDTIANVRSIIDTADGQLMLISEDGQWQMLSSQDIDRARQAGVAHQEEFGSEYLGGQN